MDKKWKYVSVIAILISITTVIYTTVSLSNRHVTEEISTDEEVNINVTSPEEVLVDVELFNDMIRDMDSEILVLNESLEDMGQQLQDMTELNRKLTKDIEVLEEELIMLEALDIKNSLQLHWDSMWASVDRYEGSLSEAQIEHVNKLLQTQFRPASNSQVIF